MQPSLAACGVRYHENPYANRPRIETILCDAAVTDSYDLGGVACRITESEARAEGQLVNMMILGHQLS
jgi:hypothetical protein